MIKMRKGTVTKDIPDNLISDYEKLGWVNAETSVEAKIESEEVKPSEEEEPKKSAIYKTKR